MSVLQNTRRTLVLTGASRGIGHATVKRFSSAGWRVITCSRQPFPEENCPWEHGPEDHVQIDLGDGESLCNGISEIRKRLAGAPLHALVNNAGISPKGEKGERLGSINTPPDLWQQVFAVNFFAPVMLARGLLEELQAGHGCILNVTSIAGGRVHPYAGTAYATSKAALAALTREMAGDFGPLGIRVNAIAPGADRGHPHEAAGPSGGGRLRDLLPLHRARELRERRGAAHQRRPAHLTRPRRPADDRPASLA